MADQKTTVRLDKFLSNAGVISRRGVKDIVKHENVTVNGVRVRESGTRINPLKDMVLLNGNRIKMSSFVYFLLNKPKGYISTTSDEQGRDTVLELIQTPERVYPVGRLDKETHGLLILTNDGELTHRLIHPRYHVPKVYRLIVKGAPTKEQLRAFRTGVLLNDGITQPAEISIVEEQAHKTVLKVTLHEGRNRQIRRMCETVRLILLDLQRISFGPLMLGSLKLGSYRSLTKKEVDALRQAATHPIDNRTSFS